MRLHINERASSELIEIMQALNLTNTGHTLNKLISKAHRELVQAQKSTTKTQDREVINDQRSTRNE